MQHKPLLSVIATSAIVLGSIGLAQAHDNGMTRQGNKAMDAQHLERKAEMLGMSATDLKKELEAGKKLKEIAEAQGLTKEQMKQRHEALHKKHLDQMVADGKITKEKAEELASKKRSMPGQHRHLQHTR